MTFLCELLQYLYICKGILVHDEIGYEFSNMKGFLSTIVKAFMLLTTIFSRPYPFVFDEHKVVDKENGVYPFIFYLLVDGTIYELDG